MKLFIASKQPANVLVCGEKTFTAGTDKTVFMITDAKQTVSIFPCGGYLPITAEIKLGEKTAEDNAANGGRIRIFDWGEYGLELEPEFAAIPVNNSPKQLAALDYPCSDGKKRTVEIYSDCGLRMLERFPSCEERGYLIDNGERAVDRAEMRTFDIGRELVLIARLFSAGGERILAFNNELSEIFDVSGNECELSDGYIVSVTRLGTVMGHEKKRRFDFRQSGIVPLPEEIGYFTAAKHTPATKRETALALTECIALGRTDEAYGLLDSELKGMLGADELADFFGSFSFCRAAPEGMCEGENILIGLYDGSASQLRIFEFSVEKGRICDIIDTAADDGE